MRLVARRLVAIAFACALEASIAHSNERGLDPRNFDPGVSACRDFFEYANGGWLQANPIPAAYSQWSLDDELRERNLNLLREILENAAAHPGAPGSTTQQLGDFYAAAIDESAIESSGLEPLRNELAAVAALKRSADVSALVRAWQARGIAVLFDFEAQEDLKDSGTVIAYAGQGGLGLPDRDYYTRDDAKSRQLRAQYRTHVERMLRLLGDANARDEARWVLALESQLAQASLDRLALRDPAASYHMFTLAEADANSPRLSWSAFFAEIGRADVQRFSLAQPGFFAAVDTLLDSAPVAHWQAYLRWRLIDAAAAYLGKQFVDADFDFHGRALRGARELKPRWKRAIDAADAALGEALGQAYVERSFPPEAKQRALTLVNNLKIALRARLENLAWMSAPTKQSAYAKLDTLVAKVGYPERWRDYSKLDISRNSYGVNMLAATQFEARRTIAKIARPPDRTEWDMTPQTVNAYYNPMRNEIVFPAAQLQPPYFDALADDAMNYGGIGSVIGHEMLHGFDDEGSQFDARGNWSDWWTGDDKLQFRARTDRLVAQFDTYVPIDRLHINGKLTLGENIADLGGLLVAYDAFKLTAQGQSDAPIDGLAPDQRFFLAFAQTWRSQQRPEQLRLQLQSNEHAPAKFRVNGPVSDVAQFARAFACKDGDPLARRDAQKVDIW